MCAFVQNQMTLVAMPKNHHETNPFWWENNDQLFVGTLCDRHLITLVLCCPISCLQVTWGTVMLLQPVIGLAHVRNNNGSKYYYNYYYKVLETKTHVLYDQIRQACMDEAVKKEEITKAHSSFHHVHCPTCTKSLAFSVYMCSAKNKNVFFSLVRRSHNFA